MLKRFRSEARWSLLLCLFLLGAIAAVTAVPYYFGIEAANQKVSGLISRTVSQDAGIPKMWDIREAQGEEFSEAMATFRQDAGRNATAVADIRDSFVAGEDAFRQAHPTAKVEYNLDIRIPEVLTPDVQRRNITWLSAPSTANKPDILRGFLSQNKQLIGVTDDQINSLRTGANYTNPDGNLSYVRFEQDINGIPVFRGDLTAGFTKRGEIIRVINNLAPGVDYARTSATFGNPLVAVEKAASHIKHEIRESDVTLNPAESTDLRVVFGGGDWATTAEKMYFPTEPGVAVPAWRVLIWRPTNAYYVIVDAEHSVVLWHKNISDDQLQSATYDVYANPNAYINAADHAAPLSPYISIPANDPTVGAQGSLIPRTNVTLVGNEGANSFNNNGWITDGTNITDGNANEAGIDRVAPSGVDATQTGTPNRMFSSTWNPPPGAPAPGDDPLTAQAQRGAVIQMFYVMNLYHDELYKRGFNEQARNFQQSNFGRNPGGATANAIAGVDRVSSEGQDSSGTNNANFSTPADGGRGVMQMFLWTGPTPDRDGTADGDIIIHEVTHGTSNRIHGNGSGLGVQGGMMGEGWGDFYAHTMLAEPTDNVNGIYGLGGYSLINGGAGFMANHYYGIRRFPTATISTTGGPNRPACNNGPCPHNPLTFGHINTGCDTTLGTSANAISSAFPRNPVFGPTASCNQVHNAGEIWKSALWEVRARLVTRLGFATGTTRVLQIVTDGMKLSPVSPNMLQGRDAIIAAAAAIPISPETSADADDVREGFRLRGMGFSASVQSASAVTQAFDNGAPDFALAVSPGSQSICAPANAVYTVNLTTQLGFTGPVTLTATGNPAGTTVVFSPNPVNPTPGMSTMTVSGTGAAAPGSYTINVVGTSGALTHNQNVSLNISNGVSAAPALTSPANGSTTGTLTPTFTWAASPGAQTYDIQIATDAAFTNIVASGTGLAGTTFTPAALASNTGYFWRVRAVNGCGNGAFSAAFTFTTPCVTGYNPSTQSGQTIPAGGTFVPLSDDDDFAVAITLPAGWTSSVYGLAVTSLSASTNGNMTVNGPASTGFTNAALPGALGGANPTLLPYWDDLDMDPVDVTGGGIFTNTIGSAPNRQFYVEWRAQHFSEGTNGPITTNFAILLTEGSDVVRYIYASTGIATQLNGASATVGIQRQSTGTNFSQFSFNTASLSAGLGITYTSTSCGGTPTPTPSPSPGVTPSPTPSPVATPTPSVTPTPAPSPSPSCAPSTQVIVDPGFEANTDLGTNPNWTSTSTAFGSSLCTVPACGTGGGAGAPRNGSLGWTWFDGTGTGTTAEVGTAVQTRVIPAGTATLSYWLRVGAVTAPSSSTMIVRIDGTAVQTITEPAVAEAAYTERTVDVSAFANGASHVISFNYSRPAGTTGSDNFLLEDVTLNVVGACGTPTPSPTPTPGVTPTPTPTPTPSPSPSPCTGATLLAENFDTAVVPALPAGWTTTQDVGTAITWTTTATGPSSAPNSAFANDPATVNMSSLVSPNVAITTATSKLAFKNKYITEPTFDGMVLEIKIGAGAFQDIITAGGTFASGGYNATISSAFMSPIAGRMAWAGTSAGGYLDTVVNIPAAASGQSVQFRWRMASDNSVAATGVNVDNVSVTDGACGGATPTPTPTPTPSPSPQTTFVDFEFGTYTVNEPNLISINLIRSGNLGVVSNVNFQTIAGGTAISGVCGVGGADHTPSNQDVVFAIGEMSKIVTVQTCSDQLAEMTETVNMQITGAHTRPAPEVDNAVLRINDTANQFRNGASICTNLNSPADIYPSPITVTTGPASIGGMRVTLFDYSHLLPDNTDVLLVGPGGQKFVLMGDSGGAVTIDPASPVTLTFRDTAGAVLPNGGPLVTGNFEPTTWETPVTNFPVGAPAGPYVEPGSTVGAGPSLFSTFGMTNANGVWNLYMCDDGGNLVAVTGCITGGWGLEFVTSTAASASISGRVMTADGLGLRNAKMVLTGNSLTTPRQVTTSSFGYYNFEDLEVGQTYVLTVNSRRYTFQVPSRVISLVDNVTDADFIADAVAIEP